MHVSLTEKLDQYVREKVQSGLYNNASEVVREALRQQITREHEQALSLEALRAELDKGIAEIERGELVEVDFAALNAELDEMLDD